MTLANLLGETCVPGREFNTERAVYSGLNSGRLARDRDKSDVREAVAFQIEKGKQLRALMGEYKKTHPDNNSNSKLNMSGEMWTVAEEFLLGSPLIPGEELAPKGHRLRNIDLSSYIQNTYDSAQMLTRKSPRYLVESTPRSRGGQAVVYKAWDSKVDRYVALKVAPGFSETGQVGTSTRQLQREAIAQERASKTRARSVGEGYFQQGIDVYDYLRTSEGPAIVMEWVDQGTLNDAIRRGLNIDQIRSLLFSLADGLDSLREQGVNHRDVKPSNVFMTESGLLLGDFGVATNVINVGEKNIVGSPTYFSPEVITGDEVGGFSDVFVAGSILFKMLTRINAFNGKTPDEIMKDVVTGVSAESKGKLDSVLKSGFSQTGAASIKKIVLRALSLKPKDRFQTVHELAEAFDRVIEEVDLANFGTQREREEDDVQTVVGYSGLQGRYEAEPNEDKIETVIGLPTEPKVSENLVHKFMSKMKWWRRRMKHKRMVRN